MKEFKVERTLGTNVQVVRFTADGRYCLTGERQSVTLWNPFKSLDDNDEGDALLIQTYKLGITHPVTSITTTVTSSTKEPSWLVAGTNKTAVVMDMVTNQVVRKLQGQLGRVNVVECTDHGQVLLTGSYDGSVYLWDGRAINNHKPVQILHEAKDSIMDILLEPQHVIRTGSIDGTMRSYDMRYGQLTNDAMGGPIVSMAKTKSGSENACLAVSCMEDSTIRLVDIGSGDLVNTYEGHHKASQFKVEVDVLANDKCVVTGSEDGSCILYDFVRATKLQSFSSRNNSNKHNPVSSVHAHPTRSSCLLTATFDGEATLWSNEY
ncbi:unnamed protein product [Cylindrotheca closterium]|uniref:Uncharacterized protein n=1 Tax=Cylindrotheca closterium TaxID=2856 RepID=A0AAD2PXE6_9STRA|nr:unnamed protein product [Cylindrotheca closterium]